MEIEELVAPVKRLRQGHKDPLGDRMKTFEEPETSRRLMPLLPVMARIDGRTFKTFTRGLPRPYDDRLSRTMQRVTRALMEETGALVGYTQSDEISLGWHLPYYDSELLFKGKIHKITSQLASIATWYFKEYVSEEIPEKIGKKAFFDARVWNVPNLMEGVNTFQWREFDATKNSISMAARAYYSHKQVNLKNTSEMQEMLWQKGINWNNYPSFFKRGSYFVRRRVLIPFSAEELSRLPEKHNARKDPGLLVERNHIFHLDTVPPLTKIPDRVALLFGDSPLDEFSTEYKELTCLKPVPDTAIELHGT